MISPLLSKTRFSIMMLFCIGSLCLSAIAGRELRIVILPFHNTGKQNALDDLQELIPRLLEVFLSQSTKHAVVDRAHLLQVLQEQSRTLRWPMAEAEKLKFGHLLSANVIISGSFLKDGGGLVIHAHAHEVASGRLIFSCTLNGKLEDLAGSLKKLYEEMSQGLQVELPDFGPGQVDSAPAFNLHFMKGLSHYYSAQYSQAVGSFIKAAQNEALAGAAHFWLAKAYSAREEYGHAYLEIKKLLSLNAADVNREEVKTMLQICLQHLSQEQIAFYDQVLSPEQHPIRRETKPNHSWLGVK